MGHVVRHITENDDVYPEEIVESKHSDITFMIDIEKTPKVLQ
jgi:hypothetical protein